MKSQSRNEDWIEVDRSDVVQDDLNPRYEKHFDVVFKFN